jgi:transcription elongation factor GreA
LVAVDDGGQRYLAASLPVGPIPRPTPTDPDRSHRRKEQPVTQKIGDGVVWLTQDGYNRLKSELEYLSGPARAELAAKIGEARDEGDLKENGGYHAAKDEQGKSEARIRQLEDMLRRAQVGETPKDDGVVEPGMKVSVKFAGDDEVETFLLGSRELLVLDSSVDIDVYSPQSPLGAAILGKKKGDKATYEAPNGKDVTVEVVAAKPFTG